MVAAAFAGYFLRDADARDSLQQCRRDEDFWIGRAYGAAVRTEELSGEEYEWPDD